MKQDLYRILAERSDSHLVSRSLSTADPESEPYLLARAPEDISGAIIQKTYSVLKSEPMIRCRQCREEHWKANHRNGYVVRLPDGSGLLVGKACGQKHFRAAWDNLTKDFQAQQKRKNYLRRRESILAAWPQVDGELNALRKTRWLRTYDLTAQSFRRRLPALHAALLKQIERSGPTLYREERVRDLRQEERNASDAPIFVLTSKAIGTINGLEFIFADSSLDDAVGKAHLALTRKVVLLAAGSREEFHRRLPEHVRAFENLLDQTALEIDKLNSLPAFAARANIEMICAWAEDTAPHDGKYIVDTRGVARETPAGLDEKWIIQHVGSPDLPALRRLIRSRAG